MNPIEDQIKAATRAEAATLREVRPLRLPPASAVAPAAGPPLARPGGGDGRPRSPPPPSSSRSPSPSS